MALKYTKKVLEYFKKPKNVGEIKKADATATEGSPACGDMMTITMKVDKKTHVIKDIKFRSYGCASNIATASIVTELAKGKTIEEVKKMKWDEAAKELGGLPAVKMHCSVLAINTLKATVHDYEIKHGLAKEGEEEFKLTKEHILEELKHVINPDIGINIVRLKMVKDVKIKGKDVTVEIKMGNTDMMFKDTLEEDIKEHMERFKDVKKLKIVIK